MDIITAKQLFEELVELCQESENPYVIEVADSIYNEVMSETSVYRITTLIEELQVRINEIDVLPEEEEYIQDIQEKIEMFLE